MGAQTNADPAPVLLHIGPHKTGTTAIQGLLASAREQLAQHGVVYPDGPEGAHHAAARAVLGQPAGWIGDKERLPEQEVWRSLVEAAQAAPRKGVISSEFLALLNADQRARVIDDLGRDRVEVVVAARNPGSIALSTWQQVLRDGRTQRLETWLENEFARPAPEPLSGNKGFWTWADTANLVDKWSALVDMDRIRVVVIDESDKLLLPHTFEDLLGVPTGTLADLTPPLGNRSLSTPEAELFLATVEKVKDELQWRNFSAFFRSGFARHLLRNRPVPAGEAKAQLPAWAAEQAATEAGATIERLRASGVQVHGDLERLRSVPSAGTNVIPETVTIELASEAMAGVILAGNRRITNLEKRVAELRDAPPDLDSISTRELAAVLRSRVRAGARRRLSRG